MQEMTARKLLRTPRLLPRGPTPHRIPTATIIDRLGRCAQRRMASQDALDASCWPPNSSTWNVVIDSWR